MAEAEKITYEAVWDEHGAVCIDEWRRHQYVENSPEVHDDVAVATAQAKCPRPTCQSLIPKFSTDPLAWKAFGKVLTAFPTENLKKPPP
jgi:hypothetical protein